MLTLPRRFTVLLLVLALLPAAVAAVEVQQSVTLYAVGDIMLGRHIGKVMKARGVDYPFREIVPTLRNADLVFGNLESSIAADNAAPFFRKNPTTSMPPPMPPRR